MLPPFDSFNFRSKFDDAEWAKLCQVLTVDPALGGVIPGSPPAQHGVQPRVDLAAAGTGRGQYGRHGGATYRREGFPDTTYKTLRSSVVFTTAVASAHPTRANRWSDFANDEILRVNHGVEVPHDLVHTAVGGWMGETLLAAYDPIFWFHHCNIDRLLQAWLDTYNVRTTADLDALRGTYLSIPWADQFSLSHPHLSPEARELFPDIDRTFSTTMMSVFNEGIRATYESPPVTPAPAHAVAPPVPIAAVPIAASDRGSGSHQRISKLMATLIRRLNMRRGDDDDKSAHA